MKLQTVCSCSQVTAAPDAGWHFRQKTRVQQRCSSGASDSLTAVSRDPSKLGNEALRDFLWLWGKPTLPLHPDSSSYPCVLCGRMEHRPVKEGIEKLDGSCVICCLHGTVRYIHLRHWLTRFQCSFMSQSGLFHGMDVTCVQIIISLAGFKWNSVVSSYCWDLTLANCKCCCEDCAPPLPWVGRNTREWSSWNLVSHGFPSCRTEPLILDDISPASCNQLSCHNCLSPTWSSMKHCHCTRNWGVLCPCSKRLWIAVLCISHRNYNLWWLCNTQTLKLTWVRLWSDFKRK